MRTPQLGLALVLAAPLAGCGAMFNGPFQTVEVRAADPESEILAAGTVLGKGKASVTGSPASPPIVWVRDRSGEMTRVELESSVNGAAVAFDILWSLTIIGVAAPISDALLDTFRGLDQPERPIVVPPAEKRRPRSIVYAPEKAYDATAYQPETTRAPFGRR